MFSRYNVIFSRQCVNVCDFKKMYKCKSTKYDGLSKCYFNWFDEKPL